MKKSIEKAFLKYLRLCARLQLRKNSRAKIVGITGSAGKTSAKLATYAATKDFLKVKLCEHGNSETGIPLDILGLKVNNYTMLDWIRLSFLSIWKLITNWEKFDVMLVEMAVDSPFPPKNMDYLLSIVRPDIGVFLNVSSVHGANYEPLLENNSDAVAGKPADENQIKELIAKEKAKLIEALPETGSAVINVDDPLVARSATKTRAKVLTIGQNAEFSLSEVEFSLEEGSEFEIVHNGQNVELEFPGLVLGKLYGYSFLSAVATATALGIPFIKAAKALEKSFELPPSRMSLFRGINGSWIIDSSYNASAISTEELINTCKSIQTLPKVAILGDMREVGSAEAEIHARIGKLALEVFDEVIFVGKIFSSVKEQIGAGQFFITAGEAVEPAQKLAFQGTLFAVKGSQNEIFLEIVVEALLADKSDLPLVCRQEPYWQKKREPFR